MTSADDVIASLSAMEPLTLFNSTEVLSTFRSILDTATPDVADVVCTAINATMSRRESCELERVECDHGIHCSVVDTKQDAQGHGLDKQIQESKEKAISTIRWAMRLSKVDIQALRQCEHFLESCTVPFSAGAASAQRVIEFARSVGTCESGFNMIEEPRNTVMMKVDRDIRDVVLVRCRAENFMSLRPRSNPALSLLEQERQDLIVCLNAAYGYVVDIELKAKLLQAYHQDPGTAQDLGGFPSANSKDAQHRGGKRAKKLKKGKGDHVAPGYDELTIVPITRVDTDPNRAVTFNESVLELANQQLNNEQLQQHWAGLQDIPAGSYHHNTQMHVSAVWYNNAVVADCVRFSCADGMMWSLPVELLNTYFKHEDQHGTPYVHLPSMYSSSWIPMQWHPEHELEHAHSFHSPWPPMTGVTSSGVPIFSV